jgi:hypothetical protein
MFISLCVLKKYKSSHCAVIRWISFWRLEAKVKSSRYLDNPVDEKNLLSGEIQWMFKSTGFRLDPANRAGP